MAKHVMVVFNPTAQSQVKTEEWIGKLVQELNRNDEYLVSFYPTTSETEPQHLVPLFKPPLDLIIAAGGDGTARFALAAVAKAQSSIPVAILPLGTGNVLARNLGIVEESLFAKPLERAYDYILNGHPTRIDMGMMNGEYFAGMAGVGPISDAFMTPQRAEKTKYKLLAYIKALLSTIAQPPSVFRITTGGKSFKVQASGIFVGNVEDLGIGKQVDLEVLADGYLDIHIVNPMSIRDYVELGMRYGGGNAENPPEYVMRVKEAVIELVPRRGVRSTIHTLSQKLRSILSRQPVKDPPRSQQLPCMIDGEEHSVTPMRVTVIPQAVNILVPKERLMEFNSGKTGDPKFDLAS